MDYVETLRILRLEVRSLCDEVAREAPAMEEALRGDLEALARYVEELEGALA